MARSLLRSLGFSALFLCTLSPSLSAQQTGSPPTVRDEPRVIDPTTLVPMPLAATATQDFSDSSLREVTEWLRQQRGLVVLVDSGALTEIGVSPAEPVSDHLDDEPIYLLLNRLRSLGLAWHYTDNVLHITSAEEAEGEQTTIPHHVGDLLDAGYKMDDLVSVISQTVAQDSWEMLGGPGVLSHLGDVLLVRQTDLLQREVRGFLSALRRHGRQTFVNTPQQHVALRAALAAEVSVDFTDTPLEDAVRQIGEAARADIRLDLPALLDQRVRTREPITLRLTDRKLETVLKAALLDLDLTWDLRDGVIWITSREVAEGHLSLAVYDVRDLCRNQTESNALIEAITSQTEPDSWDTLGGPGSIEAAQPGCLAINHEERVHRNVLDLLQTYRAALRSSKPRRIRGVDPSELKTVYYRLHADVAHDLTSKLPLLVSPDSWKSVSHPDAHGTILRVTSEPEVGGKVQDKSAAALVAPRAVLVIRQTRSAHEEIAQVLRRVGTGDRQAGFGGGMGGFGGGFFGVSAED